MLRREGITGLVCLAGSIVLLAATWNLPGPTLLVPVGPAFYPRIVLGLTAILAAVLIIADVAATRRRRPAITVPAGAMPANYGLVLTTFTIFGLYVAALPWLGFRISTFFFVAALQAALAPPRGWKKWLAAAVVALVTTVVTYFVFERYLLVLLPRGRWTEF